MDFLYFITESTVSQRKNQQQRNLEKKIILICSCMIGLMN